MSESLGDAVLELKTDGTKYFSDLDKAKTGATGLDSAFKKIGAGFLAVGSQISMMAMGIIQGFKMITGALSGLEKEYKSSAEAGIKLSNAIKATGHQGDINIKMFEDLADSIQNYSRIEDDAIIGATGALQALANLNEAGLKEVLPSLADFGEALGSVDTAASLIGKTLGTSTNALARYGIQIDTNLPKEQKLAQIIEQIQAKYGGLAKAMGQTPFGILDRFENVFGNLKEEIGKIFTTLKASAALELMPGIKDLTKWFQENSNKIVNFFLNLPEIVGIVFSRIGGIIKEAFTGGTFRKVIMAMAEIIIAGLGAAFASIGDLLGALIKSLPDIFVLLAVQIANLVKTVATDALLPKEFKGKLLDLGEWLHTTDRKVDLTQPTEKFAAQTEYENYVKEWKKYNAESAAMDKEIADLTSKSLDKIGNNIAPALGKMGERFDNFLQKGGENLKEIGTALVGLFSTGEGKSMIDEIALILGRDNPVLKQMEQNTADTADNTEDIADNTKPETGKPKTKIGLTIVPTMTAEQGQQTYGGMGTSQTGSIGVGGVKQWGNEAEPTVWEKLGNILTPVVDALGGFFSGMMGAIGSLDSVQKVLNPLQTIFTAMLQVLQPVIDSLLQPIIGILTILGQTLGAVLVPILKFFAPIIKVVADGFLWLYNKAIVPFANSIIWVFNLIRNVVATIWNAIATAINALLGWAGVHLKKMEIVDLDEGFLEEIDADDLNAAGAGGTSGGAGASYEAQRPITVTVNVHDNQVFGGSLRDFALIIKQEFESLEVLGL